MKKYYGVWPTMISIFNDDGTLDYEGNKKLTENLLQKGSDGLFAVCQSSEMFFLNLEEKVQLAKTVVETVNGRVPVIASGHTSDNFEDQLKELEAISKTGVDAVVLVSNRLAKQDEGSDVFMKNLKAVLEALPEVVFGIYECPYPYLRLLTDEELKWCADSGRIIFLKDVSCNADIQKKRVKVVEGTTLKLFNANTETLLSSLREGYVGYNGVMGNFHIDIYKWLYENFKNEPAACDALQAKLTEVGSIETRGYPINAKYHLTLEGVDVGIFSRRLEASTFTDAQKEEVHELLAWEKETLAKFKQ